LGIKDTLRPNIAHEKPVSTSEQRREQHALAVRGKKRIYQIAMAGMIPSAVQTPINQTKSMFFKEC
jgi:hypothetical protein